ncbi:MAG: glycosyltransferase family 4 protein [Bacteroidia bacterium]
MKPLRILQVTNRIPWPLNDGGNIATYNLTRALHRAGHHVELACLNTSKHRQDPMVIREAAAITAVDIDTTVTAWGAFKGLFSKMPYNVARFWSADFAGKLGQLLRERAFDLVQLEGSYMSLYIKVIRAATRAPIILRSHNVEHQIWNRLSANEPSFPKRLYLKQLGRKIETWELHHLPLVDAIAPITGPDGDYYRHQGFKGAIRPIPGGVDLSHLAGKEPMAANLRLGFLGSLEWLPNEQGLRWFLENVWPPLAQKYPNLELHVAGKNPPERLASLKVPGMTFHGTVPDAGEFLRSCHFFIVPLLSGGGMRIKVLEAMAAGCCVISTAMGAEGIEVTDGRDCLIADCPEQWMSAMEGLIGYPDRSLEIARRGQELARARYGMEAVGEEFVKFYREVLA